MRLCSLGQSQSRTFWCTSAEAKPLCLSQTKVLGVTETAYKDYSLWPLVLTSIFLEQLEVFCGGKSYLSPYLQISLKLNMAFKRPASHVLSMGRRNKLQHDPSKLCGFTTHPSPVLSMPCPLHEIFLFSWLGHPKSSLLMSTSRWGTSLPGCWLFLGFLFHQYILLLLFPLLWNQGITASLTQKQQCLF